MKIIKKTEDISKELKAIKSLVDKGKIKWSGGKPGGLIGIQIRGKPLSETVVEERD